MAEYESVLCVKQEVFVYKIPARTSNRGFRAAEWKLDEPDWTGRLKVVAKQRDLFVKLEDKTSGELFAQCPVDSYPSSAIEQVLDSSRYFVIRIQDGSGRHAFIGLGFADRGDSFDLLVAIQDHFKHVKREETVDVDGVPLDEAALNPGLKLDLSLKEGQTIKLNFVTKKSGEATSSKPRPKGQGGILLPPPPGGVKIAGPPRQSAGGQQPSAAVSSLSMQSGPPPPTFSMQPKAPSNPVAAAPQGNVDLLLDLGINSLTLQPSAAPHSGNNDGWDDFASAGSKPPTQPAAEPKTFMWENFD